MAWWNYVLAAIVGYLIGNLQFAVIISKLVFKEDVREHGSGNAGTTNMFRVYGAKSGLLTFAGDFLKGALGVILGRLIAGEMGAMLCAVMTILGHDFPVFLGFRGGKGVATSFGIIWFISPLAGAITTAAAALAFVVYKTVSIMALFAATVCLITVIIIYMNTNLPLVILIFVVWALIVVRHKDNIKRLMKGEEKRSSVGKRNKEK